MSAIAKSHATFRFAEETPVHFANPLGRGSSTAQLQQYVCLHSASCDLPLYFMPDFRRALRSMKLCMKHGERSHDALRRQTYCCSYTAVHMWIPGREGLRDGPRDSCAKQNATSDFAIVCADGVLLLRC